MARRCSFLAGASVDAVIELASTAAPVWVGAVVAGAVVAGAVVAGAVSALFGSSFFGVVVVVPAAGAAAGAAAAGAACAAAGGAACAAAGGAACAAATGENATAAGTMAIGEIRRSRRAEERRDMVAPYTIWRRRVPPRRARKSPKKSNIDPVIRASAPAPATAKATVMEGGSLSS